jgi:hypothetical protein
MSSNDPTEPYTAEDQNRAYIAFNRARDEIAEMKAAEAEADRKDGPMPDDKPIPRIHVPSKPNPIFDTIPNNAATIGFTGNSPTMIGGGTTLNIKLPESFSPQSRIVIVHEAPYKDGNIDRPEQKSVHVYGVLADGDVLTTDLAKHITDTAAWRFKDLKLDFPEGQSLNGAEQSNAPIFKILTRTRKTAKKPKANRPTLKKAPVLRPAPRS